MKKRILMILALGALVAGAAEWRPVALEESAANGGATRVLTVDYADLTTAATNTAQTLTVAIPAKCAVRLTAMVLDAAFDTANTNYTGSLAVTVGDGSDVDLYLTSTELASDGTEVWKKFGNTAWNSGTATNVTFAYGSKVYTAADTLDFIFTPNAEEAVSANTSGAMKFYFYLKP